MVPKLMIQFTEAATGGVLLEKVLIVSGFINPLLSSPLTHFSQKSPQFYFPLIPRFRLWP